MDSLWKKLGSPRNILIFEVAAQHESFSEAARRLGLSQPSVSAAIKQLEQDLGVDLFYREKRKVKLTRDGRLLYSETTDALKQIENAIDRLQTLKLENQVTLSSSSAFAHYWMVPKLHLLHKIHPDIDLRLQNSVREPDFESGDISLGLRLGNGSWLGLESVKIADEIIFPIVSPTVVKSLGRLEHVEQLITMPLIHLEEPVRKRPSWADWLAYHKVETKLPMTGLRLNDYALVLQAALAGEGYAFGWEHQVRDLIRKKLLVGYPQWGWPTGNGFYLVWSKENVLTNQAKIVRDWIISVSDFPNEM